jgi:hypothetical protein
MLNPILRGWANYYRFCTGIGKVFTSIDWYVCSLFGRFSKSLFALYRTPTSIVEKAQTGAR